MHGAEDENLPIAEAARRLGVSTLRIRQFVAEGRLVSLRDNRGRLRVRLGPEGLRPPRKQPAASATDLLMDELIELRQDNAEREVQLRRLEGMVDELSGLLGRALDALDGAQQQAGAERRRADALDRQTAHALELAERALAAARRGGKD